MRTKVDRLFLVCFTQVTFNRLFVIAPCRFTNLPHKVYGLYKCPRTIEFRILSENIPLVQIENHKLMSMDKNSHWVHQDPTS